MGLDSRVAFALIASNMTLAISKSFLLQMFLCLQIHVPQMHRSVEPGKMPKFANLYSEELKMDVPLPCDMQAC
jgi:hypothetical protein